MTRIITEKYQCANCGNELYRKKVTSYSSFFHSGDIIFCNGTFTGISPKLYFCDQCGYIGEDLSKDIDDKQKEIINSEEYRLFMEIGDKYNPYFLHFLLAFTLMKLSRYKEAVPHFICAINGDCEIFLKESVILDDFLLKSDIDFGVVLDNASDPGNLFVNSLIVECANKIDYQKEDIPFRLYYESIDAYRRIGKLNEALNLINLALKNNFSEEQISLLNAEQELCLKENVLIVVKISDEDEYNYHE